MLNKFWKRYHLIFLNIIVLINSLIFLNYLINGKNFHFAFIKFLKMSRTDYIFYLNQPMLLYLLQTLTHRRIKLPPSSFCLQITYTLVPFTISSTKASYVNLIRNSIFKCYSQLLVIILSDAPFQSRVFLISFYLNIEVLLNIHTNHINLTENS